MSMSDEKKEPCIHLHATKITLKMVRKCPIVAKIMIRSANENMQKTVFESDEIVALNLDQT